MSARRLLHRVLATIRRSRLEDELRGEIEAHLELAEQEARAAGLSPTEARRQARKQFGGLETMKESHRDERSFAGVERFARDLRHGFTSLRRNPGFTAVAVSVLALGIGANVAMFSLVDAALLAPLPFPNPERIVRVWEAPEPGSINGVNTLDFLDWQRLNKSFDALAGIRVGSVALTGEGTPARLNTVLTSPSYFRVFGLEMELGRPFQDAEAELGAAPVVVLTHRCWRTRFGADESIIGRRVTIDGQPTEVVGVLRLGPFDRDRAEVFQPLIFRPDQMNRGFHWFSTSALLKPGVTLAQANQDMAAIDASLTDLTPDWKRNWGVVVEPYDQRLLADHTRSSILIALGAVALVLLIACANVANLLLAKGATRGKEIAVRAALGAARGRLISQLMTESLALCVLGAGAGVALAYGLIAALRPIIEESLPFTADVRIDPRVLVFAVAVSLGVTLLVGLLPSLRSSATRLTDAMASAGRGTSGSSERVRRFIVAGEVALSLVLLCGALLLFKSLNALQQVETGVRDGQVITMSADLPPSAYPSEESAMSFYREAVRHISAIPGVERASVTSDLPLTGVRQGQGFSIPGTEEGFGIRYKRIDPDYFEVIGAPILAGRSFSDADRVGSPPVAIINEALAEAINQRVGVSDPVGMVLDVATPNFENSAGDGVMVEVVGIVKNERTAENLTTPDQHVFYVPLAQVARRDVFLAIQSETAAASLLPAIRDALAQVDPNLPVANIRTIKQLHDSALSGARRPAWLIGAFAGLAAFLAAIGLYGVLAQTVLQQRREIGIRMALGARASDVLKQVLSNAGSMIGIGLVVGLVGAFAMTRALESLLFEVSPLDPAAIALAVTAMLAVSLIAAAVPARRATRVAPMTVLRQD